MSAFIFHAFVQPRSFCGDFYFSWRGMKLYSASWFGGNICRLFAQMYAALCMFTAVAYVCVQILFTYTSFAYVCVRILCTLCGFCVSIRILCVLSRFCVRIRLIFTMFNADSIEVSDLEGSLIYFVHANTRDSWTVLRDPISRVPLITLSTWSTHYYWTVSRIRYWEFRWFICTRELLVIHYPILPWRFLVGLDKAILTGGVILLCTMLLCGSYINIVENYCLPWGNRPPTGAIIITL